MYLFGDDEEGFREKGTGKGVELLLLQNYVTVTSSVLNSVAGLATGSPLPSTPDTRARPFVHVTQG